MSKRMPVFPPSPPHGPGSESKPWPTQAVGTYIDIKDLHLVGSVEDLQSLGHALRHGLFTLKDTNTEVEEPLIRHTNAIRDYITYARVGQVMCNRGGIITSI